MLSLKIDLAGLGVQMLWTHAKIAREQKKFRSTKSKHHPHFYWDLGNPALLQNPNHGNPSAIYKH